MKVGRRKLGRIENVSGCFIGFSPEPKTGLGFRDSGIDSGIRTEVEWESRYIYLHHEFYIELRLTYTRSRKNILTKFL